MVSVEAIWHRVMPLYTSFTQTSQQVGQSKWAKLNWKKSSLWWKTWLAFPDGIWLSGIEIWGHCAKPLKIELTQKRENQDMILYDLIWPPFLPAWKFVSFQLWEFSTFCVNHFRLSICKWEWVEVYICWLPSCIYQKLGIVQENKILTRNTP